MGVEGPCNLDNRQKLGTSLVSQDLRDLECESGASGLTDFEARLARYSRAQKERERLVEWMASDGGKHGVPDKVREAMERCGIWLWFRHYVLSDEVRLHKGCYCNRRRLCQFCALRYGGKLLRDLTDRVGSLLEGPEGDDLWPCLVTVTVKDGEDLAERLGHLRGGLRKLNERARKLRNMGRGRPSEFVKAVGRFGSIEIKRGKRSGLWHPHSHSVVLASDIIDQDELSRQWLEITGDSHVVDVRPLHCVETGEVTLERLLNDLCEVCKYTLKFADMAPVDIWNAYLVTKGKHLHESYGSLIFTAAERRRLEQQNDDPLDEPFIDYLYQYADGEYQRREVVEGEADDLEAELWAESAFLGPVEREDAPF